MVNEPIRSLGGYLTLLEQVPWFESLGDPSERDSEVIRITDWNRWPGPEDPHVAALAQQSQNWYDTVLVAAGNRRDEVMQLWELIHRSIFTLATPKVPYDPDKDAWYGPTQCVWDAAFTASLMGCHIMLGCDIPAGLATIWSWYEAGHWPCGYTNELVGDEPSRLLVY